MHTPGRLGQGEAVLRHPLPLPGLDKERADASVLATTDGEAAGGPESEGGLSDEVLRMLPLGPCCTCSLSRFTGSLLHMLSSPFHYILVAHALFTFSLHPRCTCSLRRFIGSLLHMLSSPFHYILVAHALLTISLYSCCTHRSLHLQQGNANQPSTSFLNQAEPHPFPILQDAFIRFPRGTVLLRAFTGVPVLPRQKQEDPHSVYLCK